MPTASDSQEVLSSPPPWSQRLFEPSKKEQHTTSSSHEGSFLNWRLSNKGKNDEQTQQNGLPLSELEALILQQTASLQRRQQEHEKERIAEAIPSISLSWGDFFRNRGRDLLRTTAYCICFLALGSMMGALGPTLAELCKGVGFEESEIGGAVITSRGAGYLLGSIIGGRVFDLYDAHRILFFSSAFLSTLLAVTPLCSILILLLLVQLLLGISGGVVDVGCNNAMMCLWRERSSPYMQLLHFCYGLGALLSPLLTAQLLSHGVSVMTAYFVLAAATFPAVLLLPWLRAPRPQAELDGDVLSSAHPMASHARHITLRVVGLVSVMMLVFAGVEVALGGWLVAYATEGLLHISEERADYLLAGFSAAFMAGRLVAVPLALRIKPSVLLFFDCLGCVFGCSLLVLFPASLAAAWAGVVVMGLFLASTFPASLSLPVQLGLRIRSSVSSAIVIGSNVGEMLVPLLVALLFARFGTQVFPVTVAVLLLLALSVFLAVMVVYARDSVALSILMDDVVSVRQLWNPQETTPHAASLPTNTEPPHPLVRKPADTERVSDYALIV